MTTTEVTTTQPPQKMSLYRIGEAFEILEALLDEQGEGASEADADVVARWWSELEMTLEAKLESCVAWVQMQDRFIEGARSEARRLSHLAQTRENNVERLKKIIRDVFEAQGLKKIDTKLGPVRLVNNGGELPLVLDPSTFNVQTLPDDCKKVVVEPIKKAIRKHIEAGEVIEGASIGVRGKRVDLG